LASLLLLCLNHLLLLFLLLFSTPPTSKLLLLVLLLLPLQPPRRLQRPLFATMTWPKRNTTGDLDLRPKKMPISIKRRQARSIALARSVHEESSVTVGEDDLRERPPSPASSSRTNSCDGNPSWSAETARPESTAARTAGNSTITCSLDQGVDAAAAADARTDPPPSSPTLMRWRVTQEAGGASQSKLADRDDDGDGAAHGVAGDAIGNWTEFRGENFRHPVCRPYVHPPMSLCVAVPYVVAPRSRKCGGRTVTWLTPLSAQRHDANANDDDGNEDNGKENVYLGDEISGERQNGSGHPTFSVLRLKMAPPPTPFPSVPTISILSLPNEILLQIGEKLSQRDLDRFSRTIRRMYVLLTHRLYRMGEQIEFHDGSTVLHWGATNGLANTVTHLLEQGANPNASFQCAPYPLHSDGRTPLHIAAELGHRTIAKLLLAWGAKTKVWDRDGDTPLHLAAKNGHIKVVKLLVTAGAKITARNADGMRPLHIAVQQEQRNVIKLLIAMGADVMATDRTGGTALHLAASFYTEGICKRLIDAGADVNAKDRAGMTPLHWAAYTGFEPVVRLLVRCGSKVDARDNDGRPPWHWAGIGDNKEAFACLQKLAVKVGRDHTNSTCKQPSRSTGNRRYHCGDSTAARHCGRARL